MHIWNWSSPYPLSPGCWRAVTLTGHAYIDIPISNTANYFGFTLLCIWEYMKCWSTLCGRKNIPLTEFFKLTCSLVFIGSLLGGNGRALNGLSLLVFVSYRNKKLYSEICVMQMNQKDEFWLLTVLLVRLQDSNSPLTQSSVLAKIGLKLIDFRSR